MQHRRQSVDVVFDLGGVVVTWEPEAIAASVFDDPREKALVLARVFADPDWVELDRGSLSADDAIVRAAARTGIPAARLRPLFGAIPRSLVPIGATVALVNDLREAGHRLLVLSNLHRASLAHLETAYDLFSLFDGRVVSCEVGSCKPEAAIYRRLLEQFALDPANSVFIDDSQPNLDAAAEHGMRTHRFTDAQSCRAELQALGCI
jgi:putative hydrolase of the HAD superfamily